MADSKSMPESNRTLGDAAVDGLLAGVGAGLVMAAYLWVVGLLQGTPTAVTFGRFDPGGSAAPLTGGLVHLGVSAVYGAGFAMARRIASGLPGIGRAPGWLLGGVFGLLLLAVALGLILPGTNAAMRDVPLVHLAVAHLAYGVTLGILSSRR
jgi:hypothetical protein